MPFPPVFFLIRNLGETSFSVETSGGADGRPCYLGAQKETARFKSSNLPGDTEVISWMARSPEGSIRLISASPAGQLPACLFRSRGAPPLSSLARACNFSDYLRRVYEVARYRSKSSQYSTDYRFTSNDKLFSVAIWSDQASRVINYATGSHFHGSQRMFQSLACRASRINLHHKKCRE